MAGRKSLGKKVRFEVFKRDGFQCQYCGAHPPAAILEVDHIVAVAAGGTDDIDNLITACFDCNRGKGAEDLAQAPQTVTEKAELLKERQEQLAAYNRLVAGKRRQETRLINEIEAAFSEAFEGYGFTDSFRESVRHNFVPKLAKHELMMAIYKACGKCRRADDALKYFCGICWNIIRREDR